VTDRPGTRKEEPIIPAIQPGLPKVWSGQVRGTTDWWRDNRRWEHEPPWPGQADLAPVRAEAGDREQFVFTFRVGRGGIAPYGHLAVEFPFANLVVEGPKVGRRYKAVVRVLCSRPEPLPEVTLSIGPRWTIVDVQFTGYGLEEGDTVDLILGTPDSYPAIVPSRAMTYLLTTVVDADASGIYHRIADSPTLKVEGGPVTHLGATAPAVVAPGEAFDVSVMALDEWNENPATGYEGEVALHVLDGEASVLDSPASSMGGSKRVFRATVSGPELTRFAATDLEGGLGSVSNHVCCGPFDESLAGMRLFFGDIHTHDYNCDGVGLPDEGYRWARDVRGLDFAAHTNHAEGAKRRRVEDFWPEVVEMARRHYEPGRFVPLLAFEWGGWDLFGDKCVYYREDDGPIFGANDPRANTPDRLWKALEGRPALTIPHHPKYGGLTDWTYYDPRFQRLVEIYSTWGDSERGGDTCVQAAWARGQRLGVIGSSDDHWGQPGNDWGGLAGVWAPELTREAIFDGLWARRCYGTTGARILLAFSVNGHPMGQEIEVEPGAELAICARVAGTRPIKELAIVRDNEDVWTYRSPGQVAPVEVADVAPAEGSCFYYLRVTQEDRQMAWSSPIWIDVVK